MSLFVDKFITVLHLKKKLYGWRTLAIILFLIVVLLLSCLEMRDLNFMKSTTIARVYISGFINEDHARDRLFERIRADKHISGVIIHIDSPGGAVVGGETLYNSIRALSAHKQVVAVMGNVAASGGYMAAIAADHIIAHHNTITGSIGVLMQSFEIAELMDRLGIQVRALKAGEFKGGVSPFAKMSDESKILMQKLLDDSYDYFVSLVAKRRSITIDEARARAEGKIYTGQQALLLSLVDQIGGEKEAINWLKSNNIKGVVKDFALQEKKFSFSKLFNLPAKSSLGLLALWDGASFNEQ